MTIPAPIHVAKLGSDMLRFMRALDILDTPNMVLASLNKALRYAPGLQVMGAAMFPVRWGNWDQWKRIRRSSYIQACRTAGGRNISN